MGKKQYGQEGMYYDICLPVNKYCLCQRLTSIWNGLWKMTWKKWVLWSLMCLD